MEILKNIKKNALIILIITIIVMYFVLAKDFSLIIDNLQNLDLKYIFIGFICFFIYIIIHSYVVYKTVNQKDKFTFKESIKHNIIVQFFNGITPFQTGGQPMEIYMLSKHNINLSKATNYILQNFIFYQIALVLFGFIAVIINYFLHLFPKAPVLKELVLIGFLVNTFVALFLILISISKKFTHNIIFNVIKLLHKMHLIKDLEKTLKKYEKILVEFHQCTEDLQKNKSLFILGVSLNFIGLIFLYIIPLFIVYSLNDFKSLNIVNTLTTSAYVMIMASFVPIPGASGGIEYSYTKFFGNFLSTSKTSTTLLLWRFITYYLGMFLGAIMFNLDKEKQI